MKVGFWITILALGGAVSGAAQFGDSLRGAQALEDRGCVGCHAMRGVGGNGAPDLGVPRKGSFSPTAFAASMWNHTPQMWARIGRDGEWLPTLSDQELEDIWAYFYAVRYFEPSGDRNRGRRIFRTKQCFRCHALVVGAQAFVR